MKANQFKQRRRYVLYRLKIERPKNYHFLTLRIRKASEELHIHVYPEHKEQIFALQSSRQSRKKGWSPWDKGRHFSLVSSNVRDLHGQPMESRGSLLPKPSSYLFRWSLGYEVRTESHGSKGPSKFSQPLLAVITNRWQCCESPLSPRLSRDSITLESLQVHWLIRS